MNKSKHLDKYFAKELPPEASVLASNRLLKINKAWEMIKNIIK